MPKNGEPVRKKRTIFSKLCIVFIIFLILFILVSPLHKIDVGERGVIYNNIIGRVSDKCVGSGLHFISPLTEKLTVYPITEQTYGIARDSKEWLNGQDLSISVPTSDNQKINIDIYFTISLDKEHLDTFFEKYGGKSLQTVVSEYYDYVFRNYTNQTIIKYPMLDVYSKSRKEIQNKIYSLLQQELEPDGITVNSILIKEVRLSPEAEAILQAESKRQADIITAQGKSEANQILNTSLDENIIKLQILEKLSPDLKIVILPNSDKESINLEELFNNIINGNTGILDSKDDNQAPSIP